MSRAAVLILLLAGCMRPVLPESKPPVVPLSLLAPCIFDEPKPRTNGELLEAYGELLYVIRSCDIRLQSLRGILNAEGK